jgi:hypothetical protein
MNIGQKDYLILMADIIGSRKADQQMLMNSFKEVVTYTNGKEKKNFLSPMTITLGDEFQSVVSNLSAALEVILKMEERIVITESTFKLRYVLMEGKIETPLNKKIAYGMLGSGLTAARESLGNLKTGKNRFYFKLANEKKENALNHAFFALQRIIDDWRIKKDYYIVSEFLQHKDYKQVALDLNKERSLMWKREKSLKLEEYFAIKEVIRYIGGN